MRQRLRAFIVQERQLTPPTPSPLAVHTPGPIESPTSDEKIKIMKIIILLITLFMASICYSQNQIFVDATGNNSTGDGSISNPYSTIKYAGDQAMPGDTIFVRAGTYQNSDFGDNDIWTGEPVARLSNINGTAGNYITFIPYQNEQVVIEFDGIDGLLIQN